MTTVAIKKCGLGEVVNGYTPEDRDRVRDVIAENYPEVWKEYFDLLSEDEIPLEGRYCQQLIHSPHPVLTPEEIDKFLRSTRGFTAQQERDITGIYVTALVESSYRAGHNDFELHPHLIPFGMHLEGDKIKKLRVTIDGDLTDLGRSSTYASFTIHGKVKSAGRFAYKSEFKTTDEQTLRQFMVSVAPGCKIKFIRDGIEEKIRAT
jgi:hypothetical protein